jgi:peptide/nickel transport system ATP-binding protein
VTAPVLSVRNLTTSFRTGTGWTPVVKNLSFDIGPQETLAVVGESGSGKSVTAMSIMRLLDPKKSRIEGSIRLGDIEITTLDQESLWRLRGNDIAMIFQEPMTSLNPVLTVGDQISESLIAHRGMSSASAMAETIRLLEKVRIPNAKTRFREYPHRLSGGMRQRVMIAMALACRPKLLIADEPTTALDVTIQAQTLDLIRDLQQEEGMSVLFITHDMGVVAEIADRTLVMYRGDTIEQGMTTEIFDSPKQPYAKSLLMAVPRLGSMRGEDYPRPFPMIDGNTGTPMQAAPMADTVDRQGEPVLCVENLTKRFDLKKRLFRGVQERVHALENVSFTVRPGETLAIVGESGCGKSTAGKSILGIIEPTSGHIVINGQRLDVADATARRKVRKDVQMIFQDPYASLNPRMTVEDAIAEPLLSMQLMARQDIPAKVADLLVKVGLEAGMASRYPHEFSGGQRQRICIARALAVEPRVIVADEAVSALDVSVKAQVLNLMLELQAKMGLAYVFISHDMAVVERVAHRVAVMYLGEIVEIGTRADIFDNPQHPYTRKLIAAVPVPDPALRGTRHRMPNEEIRSPIRPATYVPPQRNYRRVAADHFVHSDPGSPQLAS